MASASQQAVELVGRREVAPEVETDLARAVIVARARANQVELAGDLAQGGTVFLAVVVVIDLETVETGVGQRSDAVTGQHPMTPPRPRVSDHGAATSGLDQRDRRRQVCRVAVDVGRLA